MPSMRAKAEQPVPQPGPMRIIHVLHSHGYGGAESHALLLMRGQRAAGHDVRFAGPGDSWLARACQAEAIPVHHVAMHGLYDPVSHLRLRRLVRQWRPDILHGHLIRGAYYAGHAAPRFVPSRPRRPVALCTAHATTARKHMGRCAHIIAVSQAVRQNLLRHGYDDARITTIYNGVPHVPPGDRPALRRELGIPDGAFAVVNAGRFVPDKGQDLLVRTLAQCPPQVHLYLIGAPDTPFGEQVRALAAQHDAARIHFLGYRPDVQRILPAFDAFALSSRREALSLAVVEAFAARLPVVATTVGGVPEIVIDGQTGLHARPEDPQSLAAGITWLASDAAQAQAYAQAARAMFEARLTVDGMVRRTMEVYERCGAGLAR